MYKIQYSKRALILTKNGENLMELKYHKWSFTKGDFYIGDDYISLKPQNIWMRKLDILKNNVDVGDIIFNWKGQIIVQMEDLHYKRQEFLMKPKGFLSRHYEVFNSNEKLVFRIIPKFSWKGFIYYYNIEIDHFSYSKEELIFFEELFMYLTFGLKLQMSQAAGAV